VVDSARIVAAKLKEELGLADLLNHGRVHESDRFFISDYTPFFEKIARMFFEGEIYLTKADIWG
jgi:glutamate racemase